MPTGISDLFFTSLREAKHENVSTLEIEKIQSDAVSRTAALSGGVPDSNTRLAHSRLTDALDQSLSLKLGRFEEALSAFQAPSQTKPWRSARLVLKGDDMENKAEAEVLPAGLGVPRDKYFTRVRDRQAETSIDPGTYKFTLTQGDTSVKNLAVTVMAGETWGDVMETVKETINNAVQTSGLSVRADTAHQNAPFQLSPGLPGSGWTLSLSVNPLREDQDVSIKDTSGHLFKELGLKETTVQTQPANDHLYQIKGGQKAVDPNYTSAAFDPGEATALALGSHNFSYTLGSGEQPTSYISSVFDPDETTTLAAGDYDFSYTFGSETKTMTVSVQDGWTWGDVMRGVAANINAHPVMSTTGGIINTSSFSQPGLEAKTEDIGIPSSTQAGVFTDGSRVVINTTDPLTGTELTLTDGDQGLLATLGLDTALTGTPVTVTVQADSDWSDVVKDLKTVVGRSSTRLQAETVHQAIRSSAVEGKTLFQEGTAASVTLLDRLIGEGLSLYDGRTGLLAALSMTAGTPGQNGKATIDGDVTVSENNTYSLDQGRVLFTVERVFGETLPLKVTSDMSAVETRLDDVVDGYNDLQKFLYANRDVFNSALTTKLAAPVSDNWTGLKALGFSKTSRENMLWINQDKFWQGLATNGPDAELTLWSEPSSLIPSWKDAAQTIREAGGKAFMKPETLLLDKEPASMSEFDLEKKNRIMSLLG